MRAATVSVGLVSPRSTCESIGAHTPLRSARSRSESPLASRSALTRAPTASADRAGFDHSGLHRCRHTSYVITDKRGHLRST